MLKSLDVYGEKIKFRLEDKEQVKTIIGVYLTVLTGILTVIAAWFLSNDIVYRNKPNYFIENSILPTYPPLKLDKYTYPLSFALSTINGTRDSFSSYFNYKVYQTTIINNKDGSINETVVDLPLIQCTREHYPALDDSFALLPYLLINQCIDDQDITLYGYWNDIALSYLTVDFYMCDYNLHPDKCATKQEIEKFINDNGMNANIYTVDQTIAVLNYTYPIKSYLTAPYKFMYSPVTKITNYMIQNNSIITDSGFFTESLDTEYYLAMNELQTEMISIDASKLVIKFVLYSSNLSTINRRNYIKITSIFGSLGGILNLLLVVFKYVNHKFTKIQKILDLSLHLNLFKLQKDNSNNSNSLQDKKANANNSSNSNSAMGNSQNILTKHNQKLKELQYRNNKVNNYVISNNANNANNNSPNNIKNQKVQTLENQNTASVDVNKNSKQERSGTKLGLIEICNLIIKQYLPCKKYKQNNLVYEQYLKNKAIINEKFEVCYLLNALEEIKYLKRILLGRNLMSMFDMMLLKNKDSNIVKKSKEELECFTNSFNTLVNKVNKSRVENRLLKMFKKLGNNNTSLSVEHSKYNNI